MSNTKYRFEQAKLARAGCRNTACKKAGIKIQKGEFRVGTFVEIEDKASFHWKHWGCVTPVQLENLQGQLEGLDLDNDDDMDVIDGWDNLTPENRALLRQALKVGHVGDDVWKGDPELNRPGQRGINRRAPKKAAVEEGTDTNEPETKPKRTSFEAMRVPPPQGHSGESDDEDSEAEDVKPKPKKSKNFAKAAAADADKEESAPAKKTTKARGKKAKAAVEDDPVSDAEEPAPAKKATKARGKKTKTAVEDCPMSEVKEPAPVKRATKARGKKNKAAVEGDPMPEVEEPVPKAKQDKKRARVDEESEEVEPAPAKKAKGKGKGKGKKAKA